MRKTWSTVVTVCLTVWGVACWCFVVWVLATHMRETVARVEYPTQMLCGLPDDAARDVREGKHAMTGCPEILRDVHAMENT